MAQECVNCTASASGVYDLHLGERWLRAVDLCEPCHRAMAEVDWIETSAPEQSVAQGR